MIGRKTAHRLAKEWFSTVINYGTLPSLIFRCEHMILTHSIYCQDDSRKIMGELPKLLEFLKHEKNRYDSKPSYKTIQKVMDFHFSNGENYRFLRVLPRITKTSSGNVLFLVTEKWNPEITQYEGLSPLFSVWVWKPGKRPAKLFLDKLYSKQYVFKTKQDAQAFMRTIKSDY